jgi:2-methylcitrate dehydratase PrpD
MSVINKLAEWSFNFRSAPASCVDTARRCFEDVFAAQIAGIGEDVAIRTRAAMQPWGAAGQAHVLGGGRAISQVAALANGTLAHALDFDDLAVEAANHPSAAIVPALLALAEERQIPSPRVLDAFLVGLELNYRLAVGVMKSHSTAGWHTTSTLGGIAAAGACARLLGLPPLQIAHALSLGVSHACGVKGQLGTQAKPVHAGLAAQHGVQAAVLASMGVEGRLDILECKMGFRAMFGGGETAGWDALDGLADDAMLLEELGVAVKRFPCCGAMHRSLDCLLELKAEHGFTPDDIEHISATVGLLNYRNLMYSDPQTTNEAKFSLQYCAGVALLHGKVSLSDFTEAAIRRPEVRALGPRIELFHHPQEAVSKLNAVPPPHKVVVTLRNGRRLERSRSYAAGTSRDPLDESARIEKFVECASGHMPRGEAMTLRKTINAFEGCGDVADFMTRVEASLAQGSRE